MSLVLGVDQAGPVAGGGLRAGDVIVAFGGKDVRTVEDLLAELRRTEPGQKVAMTIVRGGARQQVELTVGSRTG